MATFVVHDVDSNLLGIPAWEMLNRSLARAARLRSARSASSLTTEDVSLLIERVGSTREVHELIDYYAAAAAKGPNSKVAAVVKVGGDYLADAAAMRELSASLATLSRAGMQPIVVHGAGSQLNDRLASEGIESEFIGGQRVTTPAILNIAKRVFREHNDRLVGAIEAAGARARPIGSSAIEAIAANPALGLVGDIDVSGLNVDVIRNCARDGCIPVICSLGETGEGQVLNVNADVLAKTVALATGAKHVVHINDDGGLKDKSGRKIRSLNFPDEYEALAKEEWARPAFTLQLEQFRDVLKSLGDASTVLVTRPAGLLPHFFSTRGLDLAEGTTLRRTDGVQVVRSLDSPRLDLEKLTALLERSFSAESGKRLKLKSDHYDRIKSRVHAVYFSPSYRSAAIVLSDDADKKTFYLDKFALAPTTGDANAPAFGHADQLWDRMRADLPTLFWRSANTMRLDEWFLSRCDGAMRTVALAEMDDTRGTVPSAGSVAAVAKAAAVQQAAAPALPSWTGLGAAVASTASGHATGPSSTAGVVSARASETALRSVKTVIPPWTVFWYGRFISFVCSVHFLFASLVCVAHLFFFFSYHQVRTGLPRASAPQGPRRPGAAHRPRAALVRSRRGRRDHRGGAHGAARRDPRSAAEEGRHRRGTRLHRRRACADPRLSPVARDRARLVARPRWGACARLHPALRASLVARPPPHSPSRSRRALGRRRAAVSCARAHAR